MRTRTDFSPPQHPDRLGGGDAWVELVTLGHRRPADALAQRLEGEGIDVHVSAIPRRRWRGRGVSVDKAPHWFVIFVRRSRLHAARLLLADFQVKQEKLQRRTRAVVLVGALTAGTVALLAVVALSVPPRPPGMSAGDLGQSKASARLTVLREGFHGPILRGGMIRRSPANASDQ
jgi:hypothetical protein